MISARLTTFYDHAAASAAPEVHRLATTVDKWWPAILAGLVNVVKSFGPVNRLVCVVPDVCVSRRVRAVCG